MKAHELKTGRLPVDPTITSTTTNQPVVAEKVGGEPLVSKTSIQGGLAAFKAQSTGEGAGSLLQAQVVDEKKHRGRTSALKPAVIKDQLVTVSVVDTGHGIPDDVRQRLFQPFVTTKDSGMGIGLSICRTIIESHGGRLTYAPNPDGGSIFRFTLPSTASL